MQKFLAYFNNPDEAIDAVGAAIDHGVAADHISLVADDSQMSRYYQNYPDPTDQSKGGITTTTLRDAAVGAVKGTAAGIGVGALAALASLVIPGSGLVFGGGALATASAAAVGTSAAGFLSGGVLGYLKDQGVSPDLVGEYKQRFRSGEAIVEIELQSSSVDSQVLRKILTKYNARGILHSQTV